MATVKLTANYLHDDYVAVSRERVANHYNY